MDSFLLMNGVGYLVAYMANKLSNYDDDIINGVTDSVRFCDFKARAKTGDVILISNTQVSSLTRPIKETLWTHAGILIRVGDEFFEWSCHSDAEEIPNVLNVFYSGTQYVNLDMLIAQNGTIFWCQIDLTDEQRSKVQKYAQSMAYKYSFSSLIEFASYIDGLSTYFSDYGSRLNCAQAVALNYVYAGVISIKKHISQIKPGDFADGDGIEWLANCQPPRMLIGYVPSTIFDFNKK